MSKRKSTQSERLLQRVMARWSCICAQRARPIAIVLVIVAAIGFVMAWWNWSPYDSVVNQLPPNHPDRLFWESLATHNQFHADLIIRVKNVDPAIEHSATEHFEHKTDAITEEQYWLSKTETVVESLRSELELNTQMFQSVLTSNDLHPNEACQLADLSHDELQQLYFELNDAQFVLNNQWANLNAANFAEWLRLRLQESSNAMLLHAAQQQERIENDEQLTEDLQSQQCAESKANQRLVQLQHQRLLETASRFCVGLDYAFQSTNNGFAAFASANPTTSTTTTALVSPWRLNCDELFAQTTASRHQQRHSLSHAKQTTRDAGIIWLRLADQELNEYITQSVNGRTAFANQQTRKKLEAALYELETLIAHISERQPDFQIDLMGMPVDILQRSTVPYRMIAIGLIALLASISLLFIAGLACLRIYAAVIVSLFVAVGFYLGCTNLIIGQTTLQTLLLGFAVLLLSACGITIITVAYFPFRERVRCQNSGEHHMDKNNIETSILAMENAKIGVFSGGLISAILFALTAVYFWQFPVSHEVFRIPFLASLCGINQALMQLSLASVSAMIGTLAMFPAMLHLIDNEHRKTQHAVRHCIENAHQHTNDHRRHTIIDGSFTLLKHVPSSPVTLHLLISLGIVLFVALSWKKMPSNNMPIPMSPSTPNHQLAMLPVILTNDAGSFEHAQCEHHEHTINQEMQYQVLVDDFDRSNVMIFDATTRLAEYDPLKTASVARLAPLTENATSPPIIPLASKLAFTQSLEQLIQLLTLHVSQLQHQTNQQGSLFPDPNPLQTSQQEIIQCRQCCTYLYGVIQKLNNISDSNYCAIIDAYQQFVAHDFSQQLMRLRLLTDTKSLQHHEIPESLALRFLDANQKPTVWAFPISTWDSALQYPKMTSVFDSMLRSGVGPDEHRQHHAMQLTGVPALAYQSTHINRTTIWSAIPMLLALMMGIILIASRSLRMTMFAGITSIIGGMLYVMAVLHLRLPVTVVILFPLAFFPLMLPTLTVINRHGIFTTNHLKINISTLLVCFGVGTVILGHLMLSGQPPLILIGRTMTIGWVCLMSSLLLHVLTYLSPGKEKRLQLRNDKQHANQLAQVYQVSHVESHTLRDQYDRYDEPLHKPLSRSNHNAYDEPRQVMRSYRETTMELQKSPPKEKQPPQSMATRDQLDYYRERIDATQIFETSQKTLNERQDIKENHHTKQKFVEKTIERQSDKPVEKFVERPIDRQIERHAELQIEKPMERPVEPSNERNIEIRYVEKPVQQREVIEQYTIERRNDTVEVTESVLQQKPIRQTEQHANRPPERQINQRMETHIETDHSIQQPNQHQYDMLETPSFPSVWSIGTQKRNAKNRVVDAEQSQSETEQTAISRSARPGKPEKHIPLVRHDATNSDSTPMILPISTTTNAKPKRSAKKSA